jgi:hypothetical protein
MRKAFWFLALFVGVFGMTYGYAQEQNNTPEHVNAEQSKTFHAYRIDFAISELEDDKKINTRHYSMNLNGGDQQQIKIGSRVPVVTSSYLPRNGENEPENTQFQYVDVGTNIQCRLDERGDAIGLSVHSDFSNVSSPGEQNTSKPILRQPVIRQIAINGSTLAVPGKSVVIGSVDDPNSKREFQLEATVTRLR